MTYEEGILSIPKQFEYKPEIVNPDKLAVRKKIIFCGMGGSRLAGDLLNVIDPSLEIYVYSDFGLPPLSGQSLQDSLIIANSYSGETAEVISVAREAISRKLNLAVITTGGELLNIAEENSLPHIKLPKSEMPPRMMLHEDLVALAHLLGLDLSEFENCKNIDPNTTRELGLSLADEIGSKFVLVYSTEQFNELSYIWKIILNETAEVPAFSNRLPEVDHNEISGFRSKEIGQNFHCILLRDKKNIEINKRMDVLKNIYVEKGITVSDLEITNSVESLISSIILANWTAYFLAQKTGVDPVNPSVISEFKNRLN